MRHFRQPRRDQSNRPSWQDQANKSGGMINQQRTVQGRYNHQNEQQQLRQPQFPYHQNQQQYQQAQVHHGYQQQFLGQPQQQQHRQEVLDIQNRYVVDGFANEVYN